MNRLQFILLILLLIVVWGAHVHSQNYSSGAIVATSASFTPGALILGGCGSTTTSVPGAKPGMSVVATPNVDPGIGVHWLAWVSSNDTVTLRECAILTISPTSTTFNI